ncbi:hypothetical protein CsatB_024322 [Cannabis sativa]|uniref:Prefoldin subunit 1 n=1 Tax=Cannabis sativa TaxID=3483 RepID=A0A7J6GCY6_CANSA|nr:uncharacterized protein LOC115715075 [Cannabis sativa]KAF4380811.1 hypothetical protein F8388_017165 [Cannabis sativa]KAF4401908.1 hypothetical protein G4B88_017420 [Cannabis sativa]
MENKQKLELMKDLRTHQVAVAELNALSSTRSVVYHKKGNLYFRTSIQKAMASEQKQVDEAKSQLQKLTSAA